MSLYKLLKLLRPEFQANEIKKLIVPRCRTVLDLGCGSNSNLHFFCNEIKYSVGVDLCQIDLDKSKKNKIHNKYYLDDAMNISSYFKNKSFDCVMAIGLLEHLEKKEAEKLIIKMENIARKIVIIGTPNGFVPQEEYGNNPYQVHLSGFTLNDFTIRGYKVLGMDGPKILRGEQARIKYKPTTFFSIIANIFDPLLRHFPSISFNLLAYKIISD